MINPALLFDSVQKQDENGTHGRINFDANATYGVDQDLLLFVNDRLNGVLNPSSVHLGGQTGRALIEEARDVIGHFLRVKANDRLVFTSGATESNNMALTGALSFPSERTGIVVSEVEHPSILEPAKKLGTHRAKLSLVSLSANGSIYPDILSSACTPDTAIVSIMLANNETGHLFPMGQIAEIVRSHAPNALLHTDAVQAIGKIPVSFSELGVDLMSVSAHKLGGLPGVGALVMRSGLENYPSFMQGGPQEGGLRAGTENIFGIVSFAEAVRRMSEQFRERELSYIFFRDIFRECVLARLSIILDNFASGLFLPNTLCIRVPGVLADDLVVALDLEGICVSSGSACASGKPEPSHVLLALGLSETEARESIRVSFLAEYNEEKFRDACNRFVRCVEKMIKR